MRGFATAEGTRNYRQKHPVSGESYRTLGRTRWTTSTLGFGCYRIDEETPAHRAALEKALLQSCNLIDTSTNYTDGSSERCVGVVLQDLVKRRALQREEVIVVSKVGYVQGHNLELVQERKKSGKPFQEMVEYADGCWHCIHPDYIQDQLTRSLDRLGVEHIDVYLLHNPEYFLSDAQKRGSATPLNERREAFYDRLRRAFNHLEEEVEKGRLSFYGVSSNTLGQPIDDPEATSLSRIWEIARDVARERSGDPEAHRFAVVQMPGNLFESGPVLEKNTGAKGEQTALQYATDKDLGVLINRPLNAFFSNQLLRLSDFQVGAGGDDPQILLLKVAALEEEFVDHLAPLVQTGADSVAAKDFFRWGHELSHTELKKIALEHWSQLETQVITPQIQYMVQQLDTYFHGEREEKWRQWRDRYLAEVQRLLPAIRNRSASESQRVSLALSERLDPRLPESMRKETFSRKALAVLIQTPGVSCVLNGMRKPAYVDDSLGAMALPKIGVTPELFADFRPEA